MAKVEIRRATMDDAAAIHQLNCDEMGYCYALAKTENCLYSLLNNPGHCILVAVINSQVVGYAHANNYDLLYADSFKNMMGIAVSKECKRLGVGKKLLSAMEDWAKSDGAVGVRLVSGTARTEAHRFYLSCGYTKNKEQLHFSKMF